MRINRESIFRLGWIRKKYWNNHWDILDLDNLQSRSYFIFCISESWGWLSSVIDALKMGKTVKKMLKASLTLKMSISRWNFSFQHKHSELQPHIIRLYKILRHSLSAWSKINDVNGKFFFVAISVWELVHLCCCALSAKQILAHIAETHLIFKNTWISKNCFIGSIYKRISTRFSFL